MGSMMAHSTPSILLLSPHVRRTSTLLEILAAGLALVLFSTLVALHIRFVQRTGCAPRYLPTAPVVELAVLSQDRPISRFRFARERGLLLLSDASMKGLNVTVHVVRLHSTDECLGDTIGRNILRWIVGYETVAVNAFAGVGAMERPKGYVLSLQSKKLLNLLHADAGLSSQDKPIVERFSMRFVWKCGAIMTAAFIMCTTGALVAFTLKEVQLRMIKLTMDLQVIMRSQAGYGRVVVRYALDALVFIPIVTGMLFFLFEFFDDQALAFSVLILTWLCEFAASGSTRHWISREYLPKLFICYFGAFHVYFFSFPLGFSWLALATSLVFMVHAALSIWNHYELPLLRRERQSESQWR